MSSSKEKKTIECRISKGVVSQDDVEVREITLKDETEKILVSWQRAKRIRKAVKEKRKWMTLLSGIL